MLTPWMGPYTIVAHEKGAYRLKDKKDVVLQTMYSGMFILFTFFILVIIVYYENVFTSTYISQNLILQGLN